MIKIDFNPSRSFNYSSYIITEDCIPVKHKIFMIKFIENKTYIYSLNPPMILNKDHSDFFINQLDNYDTDKTFEEFERDLNEWIKSLDQKDLEQVLTSTTDKCDHSIKLYTGLMQTYKFCEKCDEKFYDKD